MILENTPNQAETQLHTLERAAAGFGPHVNAQKTEYMCFNQTGDISTLDGTSLKLVDKFTYLGSSVFCFFYPEQHHVPPLILYNNHPQSSTDFLDYYFPSLLFSGLLRFKYFYHTILFYIGMSI